MSPRHASASIRSLLHNRVSAAVCIPSARPVRTLRAGLRFTTHRSKPPAHAGPPTCCKPHTKQQRAPSRHAQYTATVLQTPACSLEGPCAHLLIILHLLLARLVLDVSVTAQWTVNAVRFRLMVNPVRSRLPERVGRRPMRESARAGQRTTARVARAEANCPASCSEELSTISGQPGVATRSKANCRKFPTS